MTEADQSVNPPQGSDSSQLLGNRIGADGWSTGWSSQFEQNENTNAGNETTEETSTMEIKSFDSLLKMYGNNAVISQADKENGGGKMDAIDGATLQADANVNVDKNKSGELKKVTIELC